MRWMLIVAIGCGQSTDPFAGTGSAVPPRDDYALGTDEGHLVIEPAAARPGAPATARIRVRPAPPYHVNEAYPIKLALEPTPGLRVDKPVLTRGDAETLAADELAIAVTVVASAAGDYTIRGTFAFGICRDNACLTKKLPVSIAIAAK
jgi:hypothetical protein